ncbi:PTS sugar transporter subunit IIA [Corynebacterium caspium]|uniref:PTS sugar transporter subunit IIA n=1 Tax=Corynebacterium caspium TaxID=234828 RepID=UPI000377262D|nr:PTS sugar transporter subunit IIA [Corynebacterium caspium]WKD59859.1 Ascorbate-specific phosphotransferase enzyme IIA component [Corynebacterium caspium DSM 44850]
MSKILSLLNSSAISLDAAASDWQEAVRTSGALLEQTGAIDAAYTESMITNVVENGPYIVISPGFAFAHARPSAAVHRTAMSWVRLKEPVEFGNPKNDPVTLVVALAATDNSTHLAAMKDLAKLVGKKAVRARLDAAKTPAELLEIIAEVGAGGAGAAAAAAATPTPATAMETLQQSTAPASKAKILTVCGNGLGTSLFLKNTLEEVLEVWGWNPYLNVEATDTISARGKAKEADAILTSGEIAKTLGDVGVPVYVIEDFTNTQLLDATMREIYDV